MDLSPEEQSFFDAGDALAGPQPAQTGAPARHRSRRHSSSRHGMRPFPRRRRWPRAVLSAVLTVAAVFAGYWFSMFVVNRDLPSVTEFGVETRGR